MSNFTKNMSAAQTAPRHGLQNVRTLVSCALLAAVSVVLARFIIPMPNETTRFSLEAVPIFLAGMLFGPLPGALVGFVADFVGCLFSGYGYNPMFCVPPILYGLCAGLFQPLLVKRRLSPPLPCRSCLPSRSARSSIRASPSPLSTAATRKRHFS